MSEPVCQARYQPTRSSSACWRVELRRPAEVGVSAAGVELEVAGFVRVGSLVENPGGAVAPESRPSVRRSRRRGERLSRRGRSCRRSRSVRVVGEKLFGQPDVAMQRLEHMLPGANGVGPANADRLAGEKAANEIGDEAIDGPVAATDDIAGASGGDGYAMTVGLAEGVDGKVRLAEGGADDLGAGLAAGVGVVAAERIGLAVGPDPLLVLVTLVGGDGDDGGARWGFGVRRRGRARCR